MAATPVAVVQQLLSDPTNPDVVYALVSDDAKYVALNFDTPDLKRIMPRAESHHGPAGFLETHVGINRYFFGYGGYQPAAAGPRQR